MRLPLPTLAPYGWTVGISDFLNANGIEVLGLTPDADNAALFPGLSGSVSGGGDAIELYFAGRGSAFDADILDVYDTNGELRAGSRSSPTAPATLLQEDTP